MAFRHRPTVSVFRSHNEDCEIYYSHNAKINSLLKAYSTQIKSAPSHYIYNVKIPASLEPDEAARRLETRSQMVFSLTGAEQRLPQVTIQSTSISNTPDDRKRREAINAENLRVAQRKLTTAIELLKSRYSVIKHTKLDNRYRHSGGGIIEDRAETTVYFAYGTKLDDVEDALIGVEILERKIPAFYILQLVNEEPFHLLRRQTRPGMERDVKVSGNNCCLIINL